MLITLLLIERDVLPQPLLYMSPWLERHKDTYIDLMFDVSQNGAWLPWLDFFLRGVTASALGTIKVVERLQDLQQDYRNRFQMARRSALVPRIIDLAFEQPVRTVSEIAELLGVSYQSAANNIAPLVKAGVAKELGSHPKRIVFEEVMKVLQVD
jgi:Fic family protein